VANLYELVIDCTILFLEKVGLNNRGKLPWYFNNIGPRWQPYKNTEVIYHSTYIYLVNNTVVNYLSFKFAIMGQCYETFNHGSFTTILW